MQFTTAAAALVLAAATVSAGSLKINNWCSTDVYIKQSSSGSCDYGATGSCADKPWVIKASNGKGNVMSLPWNRTTPAGTSVKIAKTASLSQIIQMEYDFSDQLYFDLSNLDGAGSGRTGTPFANDNVKVSPTGTGANIGNCIQIKCPAGQVCKKAYQAPDDHDTFVCPLNAGDIWVDLCEPTAPFNSRKRSQTDKHLRRHMTAVA